MGVGRRASNVRSFGLANSYSMPYKGTDSHKFGSEMLRRREKDQEKRKRNTCNPPWGEKNDT